MIRNTPVFRAIAVAMVIAVAAVFYLAEGARSPVPNYTPLQSTILGWEVENIEAVSVAERAWRGDREVSRRIRNLAFGQHRQLIGWPGSKTHGNILSVSQYQQH
jgi:hypothetical protein